MIIKCLSRKSNVDQLIRYVLADNKLEPLPKDKSKRQLYVPGIKLTKEDIKHLEAEKIDAKIMKEFKDFKGTIKELIESQFLNNRKAGKQNKKESMIITHNLRARSVNGFIKEFKENEMYRLRSRKDSVQAYHTIISFSNLDTKNIDEKALNDIANHYISLRGDNNIFVGAVHRNTDSIHMHIVMPGTQYCTGISNRITRQEFQELKVAMQEYQKEKYPELIHSLPEHGRSKNSQPNKEEVRKYKTAERATVKNSLQSCIETSLKSAKSTDQFLNQLQEQGFTNYYRAGKLTGVQHVDGLKFRFSRLGLNLNKLTQLDIQSSKQKQLINEISDLRKGYKTRGKELSEKAQAVQALSSEDVIKNMDENEARKYEQELVNQGRYFEAKQDITQNTTLLNNNEEIQLNEVREIRNSRGKEIDRDNNRNNPGRDFKSESDTNFEDTNDRNTDDDNEDSNDEKDLRNDTDDEKDTDNEI